MNLIKKQFYVEQLDRMARLYIGLPDDYDLSDKRYPVLYMHDGQNVFLTNDAFMGVTWGMLECFEKSTHPEIIVVALDSAEGDERLNEYGPFPFDVSKEFSDFGGKGDQYLDYIVHDLKPTIDAQYRTLSDPLNTGIMGASMGGVISLYAGLKFPKVFGKVASLSGSYFVSFDAFLEVIDQAKPNKLHYVYIDTGTEEEAGGTPKDYLHVNKVVYEQLKAKMDEDKLEYLEIEGGRHTESDWANRLRDILLRMFG